VSGSIASVTVPRGTFLVVASALLLAWGCTDLFHDTEWSTSCDSKPSAPGCKPAGAAAGTGAGGGDGGAGGGGGATDFGAACTISATAVCDAIASCIPSFFESYFDSMSSGCVVSQTEACEAALESEGVTITPTEYQACAEWAAANLTMCSALIRFAAGELRPPECAGTGTLPNGSGCFYGHQCQSGSCVPGADSSCGACAAPSRQFGACVDATDCVESLGCSAGACLPLADAGEACAADLAICYRDLVCRAGVCEPRALGGEACDPMLQDCAFDLFCSPTSLVCEPYGQAGIGDPCGLVAGVYETCEGISSCEPDAGGGSVCVTLADVAQACDVAAGPECKPPSVCIDGVCTAIDELVCP
jgi:hypothetical protein